MEKFKKLFYKKTQDVELFFYSLNDLSNKDNLNKLLKIIDLFNLKNVQLIGESYLVGDVFSEQEIKNMKVNFQVALKEIKKSSFIKKQHYEVNIKFRAEELKEIINILLKYDLRLFVTSDNEKDEGVEFSMVLNDREYSSITFKKFRYDYIDIIKKINHILD